MKLTNEQESLIGKLVGNGYQVIRKKVNIYGRNILIRVSEAKNCEEVIILFEDPKLRPLKHKPSKYIFCCDCHERSYWNNQTKYYVCKKCGTKQDIEHKKTNL